MFYCKSCLARVGRRGWATGLGDGVGRRVGRRCCRGGGVAIIVVLAVVLPESLFLKGFGAAVSP